MARYVCTPSSPAGRPSAPAPRPPHAHAHDRLSNGRRGRDAHGRGRQARRAARRGVALVRGQGAAVRPEPPQLRRGGGCHGAPGRAGAGRGRHVPDARHVHALVGATGLGEGGILPPGCRPVTTTTTAIDTPRRSAGERTASHRCAASPHKVDVKMKGRGQGRVRAEGKSRTGRQGRLGHAETAASAVSGVFRCGEVAVCAAADGAAESHAALPLLSLHTLYGRGGAGTKWFWRRRRRCRCGLLQRRVCFCRRLPRAAFRSGQVRHHGRRYLLLASLTFALGSWTRPLWNGGQRRSPADWQPCLHRSCGHSRLHSTRSRGDCTVVCNAARSAWRWRLRGHCSGGLAASAVVRLLIAQGGAAFAPVLRYAGAVAGPRRVWTTVAAGRSVSARSFASLLGGGVIGCCGGVGVLTAGSRGQGAAHRGRGTHRQIRGRGTRREGGGGGRSGAKGSVGRKAGYVAGLRLRGGGGSRSAWRRVGGWWGDGRARGGGGGGGRKRGGRSRGSGEPESGGCRGRRRGKEGGAAEQVGGGKGHFQRGVLEHGQAASGEARPAG